MNLRAANEARRAEHIQTTIRQTVGRMCLAQIDFATPPTVIAKLSAFSDGDTALDAPEPPDHSAKAIHRVNGAFCAEHIQTTIRQTVGRMCLAQIDFATPPTVIAKLSAFSDGDTALDAPEPPDHSAKGIHRADDTFLRRRHVGRIHCLPRLNARDRLKSL